MSKHSSFGMSFSKPVETTETEVVETVLPKNPEVKEVKEVKEIKVEKKLSGKAVKAVVLNVNANYKITGKYSGQAYFFNGAGSRQDVQEIDVDWLLSLSRGNVCCGGGTRGSIFALAEE